jgi:hypothetical protein
MLTLLVAVARAQSDNLEAVAVAVASWSCSAKLPSRQGTSPQSKLVPEVRQRLCRIPWHSLTEMMALTQA